MKKRLLKVFLVLAVLLAVLFSILVYLEKTGYVGRKIRSSLALVIEGEIGVGSTQVAFLRRRVVARDITLTAPGDSTPCVGISEAEAHLPLAALMGLSSLPDQIVVHRPRIEMVENEDGVIRPLDLVRPLILIEKIPLLSIRGGEVSLVGDGPLSHFLKDHLADDLHWKIVDVQLEANPEPASSPVFFGFQGSFQSPVINEVGISGVYRRDETLQLSLMAQGIDLTEPDVLNSLRPGSRQLLREHVEKGVLDVLFSVDALHPDSQTAFFEQIDGRVLGTDLQLNVPGLSAPLRDVVVEMTLDAGDVVLSQMRVPNGDSELTVTGSMSNQGAWNLAFDAPHFSVGSPVERALEDPALRQVIGDYSPVGILALSGEASGEGRSLESVRWKLTAVDASASFEGHIAKNENETTIGFPYRLMEVEGEVVGLDEHIEIRGLTGVHRGGERARIDGFVDVLPTHVDFDVTVEAENVPLDEELLDGVEYVNADLRAALNRVTVSGDLDFSLRSRRVGLEDDVAFSGRATAHGCTVGSSDLPVSLTDVEMKIEFGENRYEITEAKGSYADAEIKMNGIVDVTSGEAGIDLKVQATGLKASDPDLIDAMKSLGGDQAAALSGVLDRLNPEGTFDVKIDLQQQPGSDARYRAVIYPKGVDLLPSFFPIPIQGVIGKLVFGNLKSSHDALSGPLEECPQYVQAQNLEGRCLGGTVFGEVGHGGEGEGRFWGQGLVLPKGLLSRVLANEEGGDSDLRKHMAALANELSLEGTVSFEYLRSDGAAEGLEANRLTVELEEANLSGNVLPAGGLEGLSCRVWSDLIDGTVHVEGLRAFLKSGMGQVSSGDISLSIQPDGVRLVGAIDLGELSFDAGLTPLILPDLREFFVERNPSGSVFARIEEFRLELPYSKGGLRPESLRFRANARFEDCSLELPVSLSDLNGRFEVHGSGDLSQPDSLAVLGRLRDVDVKASTFSLEKLDADVSLDGKRIEISNLQAAFAGGELPSDENRVVLDARSEGRVEGHLALRGADLGRVLGQMGTSAREASGVLGIDWNFSGPVDRLGSMTGAGNLQIKDGVLWELPIFAALYKFSLGLLVGGKGKPTFDNGAASFRLKNGMIVVERFELRAPVTLAPVGMTITGRGIVGPTGVDLRVVPQVISVHLPLISPAIDLLKRGLLNYRIYGSLANPRVEYWNAATDVMAPNQDVTRLPRLSPRKSLDWSARF